MINLFKNKDLRWKRFQGGNDFDYPIDYSAALLNANQDCLLYTSDAADK